MGTQPDDLTGCPLKWDLLMRTGPLPVPSELLVAPIVMADLEWSPCSSIQSEGRIRRPRPGRPKQMRKHKVKKFKPTIYFLHSSWADDLKRPQGKERKLYLKRRYMSKQVRTETMASGKIGILQGMTITMDRLRPEPLKFKTQTQKELKRKKQRRALTGRRS